jgi:hypothetical protein
MGFVIGAFITVFLIKLNIISGITQELESDSYEYACYAKNLVDNFSYRCLYQTGRSEYLGREFLAYRPFGYPFLLAIFKGTFGASWIKAAQIFQAFLESLTVVGVIFLNSLSAKVIFVLLVAFFNIWTPLILTESVASSLIFLAFITLAFKPILAGLLIASGVFVKQTLLFASLPYIFSRKIVFCVVFVSLSLGFVAFSVRNFKECNRLTPLTSNFYRHALDGLGVNPFDFITSVKNEPCWEFKFNDTLRNVFFKHLVSNFKEVASIYKERFLTFFSANMLKDFMPALRLSFQSDDLKAFYKASIEFYSHVFCLSLLGSIFVFVYLPQFRLMVMGLWIFVVIHPILSRTDFRFLSALAYFLFFNLGLLVDFCISKISMHHALRLPSSFISDSFKIEKSNLKTKPFKKTSLY